MDTDNFTLTACFVVNSVRSLIPKDNLSTALPNHLPSS